jgi:hypothetical protein
MTGFIHHTLTPTRSSHDGSDDEAEAGWQKTSTWPTAAVVLNSGVLWRLRSEHSEGLAERMSVYGGCAHVERILMPARSETESSTSESASVKTSETDNECTHLEAWDLRFFKLHYDNAELILTYNAASGGDSGMQLKTVKIDSVERAIIELPLRATKATAAAKQLATDRYFACPAKVVMPGSLHVFTLRGKVPYDGPRYIGGREQVPFAGPRGKVPYDGPLSRASTVDESEAAVPAERFIFLGTDDADVAESWITEMTKERRE